MQRRGAAQRAGEAVAPSKVKQARFGFQRQAAVVGIALGIQAELLQALLQPGEGQPLRFQICTERPGRGCIQQGQCFLGPGSRARRGTMACTPCSTTAAR